MRWIRRWGFVQDGVCEVTIVGPGRFKVRCNKCKRPIGTFSQHESAMNWAQVHARSSKHIEG